MAIRVLLDHHIPASQILFVTFVVTPQSLLAVHAAFPGVKVITASVDRTVEKVLHHHSTTSRSSSSRRSISGGGGPSPRLRSRPPVQPPSDYARREREGRPTGAVTGSQADESDMQRVKVEEEWVVKPGFGDIGDRYYLV